MAVRAEGAAGRGLGAIPIGIVACTDSPAGSVARIVTLLVPDSPGAAANSSVWSSTQAAGTKAELLLASIVKVNWLSGPLGLLKTKARLSDESVVPCGTLTGAVATTVGARSTTARRTASATRRPSVSSERLTTNVFPAPSGRGARGRQGEGPQAGPALAVGRNIARGILLVNRHRGQGRVASSETVWAHGGRGWRPVSR